MNKTLLLVCALTGITSASQALTLNYTGNNATLNVNAIQSGQPAIVQSSQGGLDYWLQLGFKEAKVAGGAYDGLTGVEITGKANLQGSEFIGQINLPLNPQESVKIVSQTLSGITQIALNNGNPSGGGYQFPLGIDASKGASKFDGTDSFTLFLLGYTPEVKVKKTTTPESYNDLLLSQIIGQLAFKNNSVVDGLSVQAHVQGIAGSTEGSTWIVPGPKLPPPPTNVPEPTGLALTLALLGGVAWMRRRH